MQVSLNLTGIMRTLHFRSYLAHFFLARKIFQTKLVEKIKTHILLSVTFFKGHAANGIMLKIQKS